MKNIYIISIIAILATSLIAALQQLQKTKHDKQRYYNNLKAVNDSVTHYKTKSGNDATVISGLELRIEEFEETNYSLYKEVSELKLKLKNISTASKTTLTTSYTNTDTIKNTKQGPKNYVDDENYSNKPYPIQNTDSTQNFAFTNRWINCNIKITNCNIINPTDFKFEIKGDIIIASETVYKRRWLFWKRPAGIKVHATTNNPYMNIEKNEFISFK